MRLIAHRGNRWGPEKDLENTSEYIEEAIKHGFDVEVDLSVIHGACLLADAWHERRRNRF